MAEGTPNPDIPKPFSALPPDQKVIAILAVAKEPINKQMIFNFSGIQPDALKEPEKKALDAVFANPLIQSRQDEKRGVQQFSIADDKKEQVIKDLGVDDIDAEQQISDYFMRKLRV